MTRTIKKKAKWELWSIPPKRSGKWHTKRSTRKLRTLRVKDRWDVTNSDKRGRKV